MVIIDQGKCIGCGSCVKDCTVRNLVLEDGKAKVLGPCFECGHCVSLCPVDAVVMEGYNMDEVVPVPAGGGALDPEVLLTAIKCRRSIRQFKDKQVEQEKLDMILEAARYTPTGGNTQDVNFIVIRDKLKAVTELAMAELRKVGEEWMKLENPNYVQKRYAARFFNMERQYYEEGRETLFFRAPTVVVFTGDPVNASLAATNAELMANALGLGGLFVGFFRNACDIPAVREAIGLEDGRQVVCVLALGYPNVRYLRTAPRKAREIKYL